MALNTLTASDRILIVDDQPAIRRLLRATLDGGFTVEEAEDAASALQAIQDHRPSIVLLDVMMPGGMDGLQVLSEIKQAPGTRNIQVAILSARGQVADQEEARRRGADAYFIKPFSPMQVLAWVSTRPALRDTCH